MALSISSRCSWARSPLRASSDQKPAPKSAPPARAKSRIDSPKPPASRTSNGIRVLLLLQLLLLMLLNPFELLLGWPAGRDALEQPDERGGEKYVEQCKPEKGYAYPWSQGHSLLDPHDSLGDPGLAPSLGYDPAELDDYEAQETGEYY